MPSIEIIIFLLAVLVVLSALVEKLKIPQSILLVVAGLVIGFTPQLPNAELKPDTVFLLFLPPLLFTAAWKLSWHDFKAEKRPIVSLATGLVFFTTVMIAITAHYLIPGFSWSLSFVLGAILSPPDAVAATSITEGIKLNKRVVTIIEGESLLNDASALVAYRYAIAGVVSGAFSFWEAGIQFIWVAIGGIIIGLASGWLLLWGQRKIGNNTMIDISITILTPYVAYLFAEHLHFSGVLSVVAAGLLVSYRTPEAFNYQSRIHALSFWETIEFLLNGIVFILIGMQLPTIYNNIDRGDVKHAIFYSLIITIIVITVRVIWVFPGSYLASKSQKKSRREQPLHWKEIAVISWTGMRGVVSLASALAIPLALNNGHPFPQRDMILFITFCVIFLTLVGQGITLPYLIKSLNIPQDNTSEKQEELEARQYIAQDVLGYIDQNILQEEINDIVLDRLKIKYSTRISFTKGIDNNGSTTDAETMKMFTQYVVAQKFLLDHERALIVDMHKKGTFSSKVLKRLEHELDIEETRLIEQLKLINELK